MHSADDFSRSCCEKSPVVITSYTCAEWYNRHARCDSGFQTKASHLTAGVLVNNAGDFNHYCCERQGIIQQKHNQSDKVQESTTVNSPP